MAEENQTAKLVKDHVNYGVGATKETIGSVTGSEPWKEAGQADKAAAVEGMKSAGENREPSQSGFGKVEEVAGRAVGCEGMEDEGAKSKSEGQ